MISDNIARSRFLARSHASFHWMNTLIRAQMIPISTLFIGLNGLIALILSHRSSITLGK